MFELTFAMAFMIYLALTILCLFIVWAYSHYRSRKKQILSLEKDLYLCEYCHFIYLEESCKNINRCPQCHSLNQQNRYK